MAAQGVFPKIDGDVLYSSETNLFRRNGRVFSAGSTATVLSGTAFQTLGSFVINAGSLSGNPVQLNFILSTIKHTGDTVQIGISGISSNLFLTCGSDAASQGTNNKGFGHFLIGSPMPTYGFMMLMEQSSDRFNGNAAGPNGLHWSSNLGVNIDPTQTLVFFLNMRTELATTAQFNAYSIYSSSEIF